ncbi:MAG: hypothetical protein ABEK16_01050 [Candidatus Nanohalobium sp.]
MKQHIAVKGFLQDALDYSAEIAGNGVRREDADFEEAAQAYVSLEEEMAEKADGFEGSYLPVFVKQVNTMLDGLDEGMAPEEAASYAVEETTTPDDPEKIVGQILRNKQPSEMRSREFGLEDYELEGIEESFDFSY